MPKWIREAEEVIPGVKARELRRIGKGKDGDVNDVRTFLDDYDMGKLGHKAIAVVASTAAKMGAGWKPVVRAKTDQDQRQAPGGVHLPAVRPGANRQPGRAGDRDRVLPEAPLFLLGAGQRLEAGSQGPASSGSRWRSGLGDASLRCAALRILRDPPLVHRRIHQG